MGRIIRYILENKTSSKPPIKYLWLNKLMDQGIICPSQGWPHGTGNTLPGGSSIPYLILSSKKQSKLSQFGCNCPIRPVGGFFNLPFGDGWKTTDGLYMFIPPIYGLYHPSMESMVMLKMPALTRPFPSLPSFPALPFSPSFPPFPFPGAGRHPAGFTSPGEK